MIGSDETTLKISLLERNLGTVRFEALSMQQIYCNGKLTHIGSNLHDFLIERARRRLRGFIWVNGICINQKDNKEKTRQVRMMQIIYKTAQRVIIWVRNEQAGDRLGLELAMSFFPEVDGARWVKDTTYAFDEFDYKSNGVPAPFYSKSWAALFEILRQSWFSRIWVVQELLVAQNSIMCRGPLDFKTDVLLWATTQIARHRNLYESFDIFMGSPPTSALVACNIAAGYLNFKELIRVPYLILFPDIVGWKQRTPETDISPLRAYRPTSTQVS